MKEHTGFIVFDLGKSWPVEQNTSIQKLTQESGSIQFIIGKDSRFHFVILDESGSEIAYLISQKIEVFGPVRCILMFSWDEEELKIMINRDDISLFRPDDLEEVYSSYEIKNESPIPSEPSDTFFYEFNRSKVVDGEALFLNNLNELQKKLTSGEEYDFISASGILRQLFLDQGGLINKVNRRHKKQLVFDIMKAEEAPHLPKIQITIIEPTTGSGNVSSVSLSKFLAEYIVFSDGIGYTVKEVIRNCANARGGVHFGESNKEKEREVKEIGNAVELFGIHADVKLVQSICRISLKALDPLARAIADESLAIQ